jgi:hypothetical protein
MHTSYIFRFETCGAMPAALRQADEATSHSANPQKQRVSGWLSGQGLLRYADCAIQKPWPVPEVMPLELRKNQCDAELISF